MNLKAFAVSYWMMDLAVHVNQVAIESSMQKVLTTQQTQKRA